MAFYTFFLILYFAKDVFLKIPFSVILQGIQNVFLPRHSQNLAGDPEKKRLDKKTQKNKWTFIDKNINKAKSTHGCC